MSKLKNASNTEKKGFVQSLKTERKYRYGAFAFISTAIVLALVVMLNVVLGVVEDNWALSIDLSPSRVTKFDDATFETLKEVDKDIVIHLLYQDSTNTELRVQLEEMAKKYHANNNHITYDLIDPYTEPTRLSKYVDINSTTLAEGSVIVSLADDSKSRAIPKADLYNTSYVADSSSSWGYSYQQAFNGEAKLTSAIKYVQSDETPNIYFLSGHNEIDINYCGYLTKYLANENYNVDSLVLGGDVTPGQGDTIIISNPQVDITDDEYAILSDWIQNGGRLLMTMDPQAKTEDMKNFVSLLAIYQLSFGDGYVVEDSEATTHWTTTPVMVQPIVNAENDITKNIAEKNYRLIVPQGRPINACDIPLSGVLYETLLSSSDRSFVKAADANSELTDKSDAIATGSQILAYTAVKSPDIQDPGKDTRIALLSSVYLYADTNVLTSSYNLDFTMSVIEWLVNRDVSVYVRASQILNTTLDIPDAATAYTIGAVCVIIPLAVAAAGVVVWIRRRRL